MRIVTQRGFSLIELCISIVVFSLGIGAIANVYAVALMEDSNNSLQSQAQFLANSLMNEISERRFEESAALPGNAPGPGEVNGYSRAAFNDIGDYNQFKLSWGPLNPPRDENGNALASYSAFSQYVTVVNIANPVASGGGIPVPRNFTAVADGTTDFKLVTVTISWGKGKQAQSVVLAKVFGLP
jgi:prepilin-type N-terminal cleavage/methylation domain-containing protein